MANKPLSSQFTDRLQSQFGPDGYDKIMKGFRARRLPTFRVNTTKSTNEEIVEFLVENKIAYEQSDTVPHAFIIKRMSSEDLLKLPICKDGKIYVQGLSSMVPPLVLSPGAGEHVLDLCAAPGSKTSQMAAMMEQTGKLVAMEQNQIRFGKLKFTIDKQGADVVEAMKGDAIKLCTRYKGKFDAILADVPCSAEGRMNLAYERSYGYWSEVNIEKNVKLQRELMTAAIPCLKPGGRIVYSTCTLAPEENESMIAWLLEEFTELHLEEIAPPLLDHRVPGGCYILPSESHEGMFISMLRMGS
ncbi:RsmB/NOP family class I SAM-dependent RNA methyltransferase [Candidatus Uhrbacteria bacterium]|nr:RsmB/NOP family class I SAM-dependent RNA methyltransferase [Candidatus Uhrbacteria bacterium]